MRQAAVQRVSMGRWMISLGHHKKARLDSTVHSVFDACHVYEGTRFYCVVTSSFDLCPSRNSSPITNKQIP
jgi:hypothetical protein